MTEDSAKPEPTDPSAAPAPDNDRIGGRGTSSRAVAVVSSADRTGSWVVPPKFSAVAVAGSLDIDLTQARFEARETTIRATALFGGISVTVPDDITVVVNGTGFLGGFEGHAAPESQPDSPVVRVTGFAMAGSVDVTTSTSN